jgi:hypothetical protein
VVFVGGMVLDEGLRTSIVVSLEVEVDAFGLLAFLFSSSSQGDGRALLMCYWKVRNGSIGEQ